MTRSNHHASWLALLRAHLPFDLLMSEAVRQLGPEQLAARFKLIVLADSVCMARRELELFAGYVRAGGGLLLLGEPAGRNEIGQLARADRFASVFGMPMPEPDRVTPLGKGRLLRKPGVWANPATCPDLNESPWPWPELLLPQKLPGWEELPKAVFQALGQPPAIRFDGPGTTFCSASVLRDGSTAVYLLNYAAESMSSSGRLFLNGPSARCKTEFLSPESSKKTLTATPTDDGEAVVVPSFQCYAVLRIGR